MELLDRLQKIVSYTKKSDRAFAISCNIKQPTFDKQIKGLRSISTDTIIAVCMAYPEISAEWLLLEQGEMIKENNINTDSTNQRQFQRIEKLISTIEILQDTITSLKETNSALQTRIAQLENQLK